MASLKLFTEVYKSVFKAYGSLISLLDPGREGNPYMPERPADSVIQFTSSHKLFSGSVRRRMMMRI